jgi:hypothetical protein
MLKLKGADGPEGETDNAVTKTTTAAGNANGDAAAAGKDTENHANDENNNPTVGGVAGAAAATPAPMASSKVAQRLKLLEREPLSPQGSLSNLLDDADLGLKVSSPSHSVEPAAASSPMADSATRGAPSHADDFLAGAELLMELAAVVEAIGEEADAQGGGM